ncbi:MAG: sulfate ABC transporter permease subunit CysT [Solirubrobacteraceae bacterium]
MPSEALTGRARVARRSRAEGAGLLGLGISTLWLSLVVLIPMAALLARATDGGLAHFGAAVSGRAAVSALVLTLWISAAVAAANALFGTLTAWVLARDRFRGRGVVNALIDLPFALPTVVVGIILLALAGPRSPLGTNVVGTRWAIVLALLFVTLPFVVRSVQPVVLELDREMEQAAASLGASETTIMRRIVLPNLAPAILSGAAMSFARAVGEFGSVVLVAGNIPFHTQLASVYIFGQVESDDPVGAAAVSVVLLAISLLVLLGISLAGRRGHDR